MVASTTSSDSGPPVLSSEATSSPTPTTPQMYPVINPQPLKELKELGGLTFLQSMIRKFVEDSLHCVTKIEQAMDSQDLTHLQEAAHRLKGIARNMGADAFAQLALQFATTSQAGKSESLMDLLPHLQDTVHRTRLGLEHPFGKS